MEGLNPVRDAPPVNTAEKYSSKFTQGQSKQTSHSGQSAVVQQLRAEPK
jgi:hypothetical protein